MVRKYLASTAVAVLMAAIPVAADELKVVAAGDMRSLIPAGNTGPDTHTPMLNIYEGLTAWTQNGTIAPMLAEDLPEVSQDGLTYRFRLRDGVSFHDGSPLTAEAVAGSWKFLLDPLTSWPCRNYYSSPTGLNIEDVVAAGPLDVAFRLARPSGEFLVQITRTDCASGGVMSPAFVAAGGKGDKPAGTGPYRVDEISTGRYFVLKRFEDYSPRSEPGDGWAGRKEAVVDTVRFVVIGDVAASYAALVAKDVDLWPSIDKRYIQRLREAEGITVTNDIIPSFVSLPINATRGVLASADFRKAMNYAINRGELITAITEGGAAYNSSIIPASSEYFDIVQKNQFTYDTEKAKELIAKSGYNGEQITVTTNNNWAIMHDTGLMVQAYLQAVGINAQLEVLDFASQLPKYNNGQYDLMTFNYAAALDPALIVDRIAGSRADNPAKVWENEDARKLTNELITTPPAQRRELYEKLHALYMEDPALLIWASADTTGAFLDRVEGYKAWPGQLPRLWTITLK